MPDVIVLSRTWATRTDLAWAAGLFEGEGCITVINPEGHKSSRGGPRLALNSTDEDVLQKFIGVVGCGRMNGPYHNGPRRKPIWHWVCGGFENVQAICAMFWHFLCTRRRARIVEVLTRFNTRMTHKYKQVCAKGHVYTPENTGRSWGQRYCRMCKNANNRRYAAERRSRAL